MTDFEKKLRAALHREAAELVPEGTAPPGLPTTSERGWFVRWRVPLLAAAAVVVVAATVTTVVIQQRGGGQTVAGPSAGNSAATGDGGTAASSGHDTTAACDIAPEAAPQFLTLASWVKDYASLDELAGDSTNIVIATPTGDSRDEPLPDGAANPKVPDTAPNAYATLAVDSVLSGQDVTTGQQIEVLAPGEDTNGCPMFSVPGRYLLFLAPYILGESEQDPAAWTGQYIAVSSYAGVYFHEPDSADGVFTRTFQDFEELPEEVDVDTAALMAGWYDAAYLDHVAAGEDPITLPPLNHPAGSVASPIVGGPVDPFLCNGAETTSAASPDDGGTLFGLTDTRFCVSLAGSSADDRVSRSEMLIAPAPFHAVMRVGDGWESQVAGVVDSSVTAVVAVRGADDATHPDDPLPDWEVPLTELGEMRAFVADNLTRVLVAYSEGSEVSRWPVRMEFTDDPTGGWGDGLELYDLRDDLTDLVPAALTRWTQIDPDTIRVFFTGGNSACYGAVATIQEDEQQVRVDVQKGWKPEVGGCDDMAVGAAVDIALDSPLGARTVASLD